MCGRFTLSSPGEVVAELFELAEVPDLTPRYNVAPTQPVTAVLLMGDDTTRRLQMLRWGLIPSWAQDPNIGARMINARAETAATKPAFRSVFRQRRCLVVADGFYEWQKLERRKQPFYIRMRDGRPFAFAGLWEHWEGPDGRAIDSCTVITTGPNELMAPLHDRMPVILNSNDYGIWLDPCTQETSALQCLLRPYPADEMSAYPVGTRVNNPSVDDPECIHPLA
jgi:putative SOS response-associated peptidase YedK